ncbi:6721_t:CDS:2 [Rhizophagus irregularis]|nr:6721_t:CDS:2 [Rhizophagus irregularis]
MSSTKLREIPLEETIRKVLHNELKLIFPPQFFQDSSLIMSKQIVAPMEPKKEPQRDTPSLAENISPDSDEEESLDEPMEINFVKKKEPLTSTTTIKCKIGRLKIPAMTVDSGAEPPIITKNIVDRIKVKIDKSEKYDLSGISTVPVETIGVVRNLPITLAPGCTIHEDFVVVDYHKPILIFSNRLLKKYGCAMDWKTDELKIPFNGKDYIIPVTMHKVKNKLEDPQDLSEDETLKKSELCKVPFG